MICRSALILILILSLLGTGHSASSSTQSPDPHLLLQEALKTAADNPEQLQILRSFAPLMYVRLSTVFRLHGHNAEALEALNLFIESARQTVPDSCRLLGLLGEYDAAVKHADSLSGQYLQSLGYYFTAVAAVECGDAERAESIIRALMEMNSSRRLLDDDQGQIEEDSIPGIGKADDSVLRNCIRLAIQRMNRLPLAEELYIRIESPFWKTAASADLGVAYANNGKVNEAVELLIECEDSYQAVISCAKVAAGLHIANAKDAFDRSLNCLRKYAAEISEPIARDAALRVATRKIAEAGAGNEAALLIKEIKDPCLQVLARCEIITDQNFADISEAAAQCPRIEHPALFESIVVACGMRGLPSKALTAVENMPPGWPRVRALGEAARHLVDAGANEEAELLLKRAEREVKAETDAGQRAFIHLHLALLYNHAGSAAPVSEHLRASSAVLNQTDDETWGALLPEIVEAAIYGRHSELARDIILKALAKPAPSALRARLIPMLVSAGYPDLALAECAREPLKDDYLSPHRYMAYRLARAGEADKAVEYARALTGRVRVEALTDIALAMVEKKFPQYTGPRAAGIYANGNYWPSWGTRMERMGEAWEIVPFMAPYEYGEEELRARYSVLQFTGAGTHKYNISVPGFDSLRNFSYGGGGLFGICAGMFSLTSESNFMPIRETYHPMGWGPHQVQIIKGHPVSLLLDNVVIINRSNGPFISPVAGPDLIGWYDKEQRYAAALAHNKGIGRLVAFSPHPESGVNYDQNDRLCMSAISWVLRGMP